MSCFQVHDEHIHVMIHAALRYAREGNIGEFVVPTAEPVNPERAVIAWWDGINRLVLTIATADRVGQMLRDANTACLNAKYDEDEAYVYTYRQPKHLHWTPLEILHATNGYRYQSNEAPSWRDSPAAAFCAQLEAGMIHSLPGYEEGPWTIDADSVPIAQGY